MELRRHLAIGDLASLSNGRREVFNDGICSYDPTWVDSSLMVSVATEVNDKSGMAVAVR